MRTPSSKNHNHEEDSMSLYELKDNKGRILSLFPSRDHHLAMEAVIGGNCEGKIFVDDAEDPKTVAVWTVPHDEPTLYIAGASSNSRFNEALHTYFIETIKPESVNQGYDAFQVYPTGDWEHVLRDVIFKGFNLLKETDSYYKLDPPTFNRFHANWRENIPDGFTVKRVESKDIFEKTEENIPTFANFNSWRSFEKFREHGFGYYLVEDNTNNIVSGCKTKFVTQSRCEIAIETDQEYRRKGFATVVACATLSEAAEKGLEVIWEVWSKNTASVKTNQKLGFVYICDEEVYYGLFDELEGYLYFGYYYLTYVDDPHTAVHWFEKGIHTSEVKNQRISSGYNYHAARAFAVTEKYDAAFERLHNALDGAQDAARFYDLLVSEKAFDKLRGFKEFEIILQRAKNLAEK